MNPRPGDGEAQASPSARSGRKSRPRIRPGDMPLVERREAAMAIAVRALGSRERSQVELRLALARKGFDRETILLTLDRLKSSGLQDDARFAETFATEAAGRRGMSGSAIRNHLRGRGVTGELAARAAASSPEDEEARARLAASKRLRALGNLPPEVGRRRLAGFLARRGYSGELCFRLAGELIPDTRGD